MAASDVVVEDAESVRKQKEQLPLYTPRVPVYPKAVSGIFRRVKWAALILLLGLYYVGPWLRWDRGPGAPDQAFLIDMPNRRAYFLWIEIWPQEVYYIAALLMIGAFGLFLATALFGRIWCGFTCPQTVWTDLFLWVERLIEGDRNARIRLEKAPWTAAKVAKRVSKHAVWLVIAALTGGAWVMYFNDAPTLLDDILHLEVSTNVLFFVGLFTAATYLLAGFMREQVCTYMCPWPRFQAAMYDEESLIVSYEAWRGEPRGHHKHGESWEGRGDCVACNQCVAVCPTGIDIRDGNQLECIGCALCVDACNAVMARVGLPAGLITWDSITRQNARAEGKSAKFRFVRPRTLFYVALLLIVGSVVLFTLGTRADLELNVIRDRSPLFVRLADGSVRNAYTVKILNKVNEERDFLLSVEGLAQSDIRTVGTEVTGSALQLIGKADTVTTYRVFVHTKQRSIPGGSADFEFVLKERSVASPAEARYEAVLRGPES